MDLIHELRSIQNWIDENTKLCDCSVGLVLEDVEIKISISIRSGWDWLIDEKRNFNACDWETNKKGAEDFVRNFEYKKYKDVTIDNYKDYIKAK